MPSSEKLITNLRFGKVSRYKGGGKREPATTANWRTHGPLWWTLQQWNNAICNGLSSTSVSCLVGMQIAPVLPGIFRTQTPMIFRGINKQLRIFLSVHVPLADLVTCVTTYKWDMSCNKINKFMIFSSNSSRISTSVKTTGTKEECTFTHGCTQLQPYSFPLL